MIEVANNTASLTNENFSGASVLTRRLYDAISPFYALPTMLFHAKAHAIALNASSVENGSRVLEVAIGSGEMLKRLVKDNRRGQTVGVDLSPKMAALSQERASREFPEASVQCQAADVRFLPFPTGHFDTVVCCYLFELLPEKDVPATLLELRRVLRPGGRLTSILVAQNDDRFNAMYRVCSTFAPAFWGHQRVDHILGLLEHNGFLTDTDTHTKQLFYSSRIVSAISALD